MKFAKSILMGTGSVVLAGLMLALFVPKAAHALAATAVQVMNTMANPVPTVKMDDPGRIPYQTTVSTPLGNQDCTNGCIETGPPVLAGKRLVITNVSGKVSETLAGGSLVMMDIFADGGINVIPTVTYQGNYAGLNYFAFGQPTQLVYNAGSNPTFVVYLGAVSTGGFANVAFTGYLLDCSTGPCAAIAP